MIELIRLLLVGKPGTELRLAADMARDAGAAVAMADTPADALTILRDTGAALAMIDVAFDVAGFISQLRAERFALPVLACGIEASATLAVAAIRAGARDYVPLPPERALIAAAIASTVPHPPAQMIGEDSALRHALGFGIAVAHGRSPLLVSGERGSGKEVMARAIHDASGRPGRFLTVECAGVAPEIVESELFGHEPGAFPAAAARRLGRFEKAAQGTLFVRDIDHLAPAAQTKLHAALHEGAVRRLGGADAVPISARLMVSTAADLDARVAESGFRADLLARLMLVRINLPPLRKRAGDISLLAEHFASRMALANGLPPLPFRADTLALLAAYPWPGNVRELEDVLHRAVLLAQGPDIGPEAIVLADGSRISGGRPSPIGRAEVDALIGHTVEAVERELILHTLERCHGNRTCASGILGISVRTMRNKLKAFIDAGIPVAPAH